jgi:hypothetical protein
MSATRVRLLGARQVTPGPRPGPRRSSPNGAARLPQEASASRGWQWMLALLPVFPLILLVLRLWLLSRQDLPTMLLLVQTVNPLGLASALVITLIWVPPAVMLSGHTLSLLLLVSLPPETAARSWLATRAARMPNWVVTVFVVWGAVTWQLRFLPTLLALAVAITGLTIRYRYPAHRALIGVTCWWLPLTTAVLGYAWLAPGIAAAYRDRDLATLLLFTGPPAASMLLTGPLPRQAARVTVLWLTTSAAFVAPFLVGVIFLQTPVLPPVAIEVGDQAGGRVDVIRSDIVSVDDRMTTLLDGDGTVRFIPNDQVRSKTLCASTAQVPYSAIAVRGWNVEQTILEWLSPPRIPADDPRCQGRPLGNP